MNNSLLSFNLSAYNKLDPFAFHMQSTDKYGNNGNWFYYFRAGLSGFGNRLYGIRQHYYNMFALHPHDFNGYEYNLTALLFHMDSAIECLNFALNALGYGVSPKDFMDITNFKYLRNIRPSKTILKNPPLSGYKKYFPNLTLYWQSKKESLLDIIQDQHDVSKHRTSIFSGYDSPTDVILRPDPKESICKPQEKNNLHLTSVVKEFCEFINKSGQEAFKDATTYIKSPSL